MFLTKDLLFVFLASVFLAPVTPSLSSQSVDRSPPLRLPTLACRRRRGGIRRPPPTRPRDFTGTQNGKKGARKGGRKVKGAIAPLKMLNSHSTRAIYHPFHFALIPPPSIALQGDLNYRTQCPVGEIMSRLAASSEVEKAKRGWPVYSGHTWRWVVPFPFFLLTVFFHSSLYLGLHASLSVALCQRGSRRDTFQYAFSLRRFVRTFYFQTFTSNRIDHVSGVLNFRCV